MQAAAQLLFKYGSITPSHWLLGFIGGNAFGASSIIFLILLYRAMNPHLALGLATGGAFLCAQFSIAAVFKSHISLLQYGAMMLITAGMILFAAAMKSA